MREPQCSAEVRRLLVRHGVPANRIARVTSELAEHWEELRATALDNGLSVAEAEAEADTRLGEPARLAAETIAALRHGSWLGRHPILSICIAPLVLAPMLMTSVALPLYWLNDLTHFASWNEPGGRLDMRLAATTLWLLYYTSAILAVAWLTWRSWIAGLGIRWIVAICSWCALTSVLRFLNVDITTRNVTLGFSFPFPLNTQTIVILLLHAMIAAGFLVWARLHDVVRPRRSTSSTI